MTNSCIQYDCRCRESPRGSGGMRSRGTPRALTPPTCRAASTTTRPAREPSTPKKLVSQSDSHRSAPNQLNIFPSVSKRGAARLSRETAHPPRAPGPGSTRRPRVDLLEESGVRGPSGVRRMRRSGSLRRSARSFRSRKRCHAWQSYRPPGPRRWHRRLR